MFNIAKFLKAIQTERPIQFSQVNFTVFRNTRFSAAMAEALDKFQSEKERKSKRNADDEEALNSKFKKRRKWQAENEINTVELEERRAAFDPANRVKRKKTALLLSYCGANYYGMQRNPGMATIEEELFNAMLKHNWIPTDAFNQIQMVKFQRAARTDKGVSAVRQVCSMKLADKLDINELNASLPEQIRVFGLVRVTKGFNSKDQCNARTYTYTMPTFVLAPCSSETTDLLNYRVTQEQLKKLTDTLQLYEGTENFHNFTSKKNFHDPSAKRFIMSFKHTEPFIIPEEIEFITLKVKGQSFMLHQIRKMIGLAIAIVRGNTTVETLEHAFSEQRIDLPTAPGLGLVLDTVHYDRYNERYGQDGLHEPLTWEAQEKKVHEFAEKYIYSNIYATELKERPMLEWLNTLSLHTYEARQDEESLTSQNTKENDDEK